MTDPAAEPATESEEAPAAADDGPVLEPAEGGPTLEGAGNRDALVDIAESYRAAAEGGGEEAAAGEGEEAAAGEEEAAPETTAE
jgi:hypothetical protein